MADHLSQGCEPCGEMLAMLERMYRETRAETPVPEELVQAAKSVFPAAQAAPVASTDWLAYPRLVAQLLYSSLASPVAEGTRAESDATVQAVFQGGDYSVDLQIERDPESTDMAVVGQIVNRAASGQPMPHLPVVLMARNKMVCQAQSNRFGEFCLVSKVQSGLRLCLPIAPLGKQLEIPLSKVIAGLQ